MTTHRRIHETRATWQWLKSAEAAYVLEGGQARHAWVTSEYAADDIPHHSYPAPRWVYHERYNRMLKIRYGF